MVKTDNRRYIRKKRDRFRKGARDEKGGGGSHEREYNKNEMYKTTHQPTTRSLHYCIVYENENEPHNRFHYETKEEKGNLGLFVERLIVSRARGGSSLMLGGGGC